MRDAAGFVFRMWDKSSATLSSSIKIQALVLLSASKNFLNCLFLTINKILIRLGLSLESEKKSQPLKWAITNKKGTSHIV